MRLVGPDGSQIGIVATQDALRRAKELDLDLVEVAPHYEGPAQITALAGATLAHDEVYLVAGAPRRSR